MGVGPIKWPIEFRQSGNRSPPPDQPSQLADTATPASAGFAPSIRAARRKIIEYFSCLNKFLADDWTITHLFLE
jgi:hypothetical protein